jgi:molybdopterin converting factor small subunit
MAFLLVPSSLRRYTEQQSRVEMQASSVNEALERFSQGSADLRNHLFSGAMLRKFVVICKNGQDIRLLEGLQTPLSDTDELRIVASVAGG